MLDMQVNVCSVSGRVQGNGAVVAGCSAAATLSKLLLLAPWCVTRFRLYILMISNVLTITMKVLLRHAGRG